MKIKLPTGKLSFNLYILFRNTFESNMIFLKQLRPHNERKLKAMLRLWKQYNISFNSCTCKIIFGFSSTEFNKENNFCNVVDLAS